MNVGSLQAISAPFENSNSVCASMSNDNILIVGSDYSAAFFKLLLNTKFQPSLGQM